MSETAGFGVPDWLPARVQRAIYLESVAEEREARQAEAQRQERAEAAADKSMAAYRAGAEMRGEYVSAMAMATGEIPGRAVADIFGDARRAADREDARDAIARQRWDGDGEPVHVVVGEPAVGRRSDGWPGSAYEADRLVTRARDLHSDLVMYQARRNGTTFDEATAQRSVSRDEYAPYAPGHVITRGYTAGSW